MQKRLAGQVINMILFKHGFRAIKKLYENSDLSYGDIAELMDVGKGTVSRMISEEDD